MNYAIVHVPAAPVRRKARHQSEMINQLLFGDGVKVLKKKGPGWVKVRSLTDDYEGWITEKQLYPVREEEARALPQQVTSSLLNTLQLKDSTMHIPMGCFLPGFVDGNGNLGEIAYSLQNGFGNRSENPRSAEKLRELTYAWLNAPYLWGGKTLLGVDCSGFVQINYRMMGIDLPRDAWQQAQQGKIIERLKESAPGDLAFFDDRDEIVHVGILLGEGKIIHASGKVRIDTIDKKGIIHSETGKRTHSLRVIKRCW